MFEQHKEFIDWASQYEFGGTYMRSRALHKKWMEGLKCPLVKIEGNLSVEERVEIVLEKIKIYDI